MPLAIVNPLASTPGAVTIGSTSTPAGDGNAGTMTTDINPPATASSPSTFSDVNPNAAAQNNADNPVSTPTSSNVPAATPTTTGPTAAQLAEQANVGNLQTADMNAINTAIGTSAGDYGNDILGDMTLDTNSQNTINANAVQNQLAEDQGEQGVTNMVNNGIAGGAVQIDDAGGGTSSAGQQLAQDYGIVGRQAASSVGNQFAQGQNSIANQQTALGLTENEQTNPTTGDLVTKQNDAINSIVSNATSTLQYLDLMAQEADVTDLPDINSQIASVKANATAQLSALDGQIQTPTAEATPAVQAQAQGLFAAGTAPTAPFNYTTTAPATVANTGPSPSSLPIYIAPKNNDNTTT